MWVRNPTYSKRRQSQQIVWFSTSMRMYAAKHSIKSAILCSTIFINIRFHTRKTREKHFAYAEKEPETEKQTERPIQKANERMNDDNKKCHERSMFIFCLTLARFLCMAGLFSVGLNWTHDVCWCHAASDFVECEICVWKLPTSLSLLFFLLVLRFSLSHIIHSFALSVRLSSRCYYEHN